MIAADQELIDDFVVESNEHLADVENQLLAMEAGGEDIDIELVNTVFRAVHSIKGVAGFLGFDTINDLAHRLENVLNHIRNSELIPTSQVVDSLLRSIDVLQDLVNDTAQSNDVDVLQYLRELDLVSQTAGSRPSEANEAASSQDTAEEAPSPKAAAEETPSPKIAVKEKPQAKSPVSKADKPPAAGSGQEISIRVAVSTLDHLMNLAGELVLSRNQILQTLRTGRQTELDDVVARLDQVTCELQEAIMQTRMQPIGNVFGRFPRVVRDLSNKLGKECELRIVGNEVEVDKSISEAINDPLTHLVRNAIDHGVERPDVRVAAGKSPRGELELRAYHQAGKVCLDIRDDGGGIDPAKLREKAVEKGLITAEQATQMGDREAIRLIFHPGFSTVEKVTDVSGRGVGMDVVRTNIEGFGGTIDIESTVGVGTTIRLTMPLTLAIIPSLIVRCGAHRYAVPQVNIAELVQVRSTEVAKRIGRVRDAEVLRLRGTLLPLVRLSQVFGTAPTDDQEQEGPPIDRDVNIIIVEAGQTRYGLIVDALYDSEEIVVKPLGQHLGGCRCFAGATILGDGQVALILDVMGTASRVELRTAEEERDVAGDGENELALGDQSQSVLLFTNSPDEFFAVPMGIVARIERVRPEQIDSVGGNEVLQFRGASLPLLRVEDCLQAKPRPEMDQIDVIVFEINDREIGLIAPRMKDIRDVSTDVDTITFREPGVIGSIVVDEKVTRILDVFELAAAAHPEWFVADADESTLEGRTATILVAEDSAFFRSQVSGFLRTQGYDVVEAEDGLVAWNELIGGQHDIDLVVTDIEMPNLTGLELCQRIRENPALQHLPVIAVTSHTGEEDVQRGREVGVNEYQVKMDRERLRAAVARHLNVEGHTGRDDEVTASQIVEMGV
jgi:two-component system chemotaxis sensor kinase CheA